MALSQGSCKFGLHSEIVSEEDPGYPPSKQLDNNFPDEILMQQGWETFHLLQSIQSFDEESGDVHSRLHLRNVYYTFRVFPFDRFFNECQKVRVIVERANQRKRDPKACQQILNIVNHGYRWVEHELYTWDDDPVPAYSYNDSSTDKKNLHLEHVHFEPTSCFDSTSATSKEAAMHDFTYPKFPTSVSQRTVSKLEELRQKDSGHRQLPFLFPSQLQDSPAWVFCHRCNYFTLSAVYTAFGRLLLPTSFGIIGRRDVIHRCQNRNCRQVIAVRRRRSHAPLANEVDITMLDAYVRKKMIWKGFRFVQVLSDLQRPALGLAEL
ncbi:hypothetical protein BJ508DRAFT_313873 [Ascobolus immersus RN42]|uniref:Uncharacterized protein n=1 Tax=Ascobolus immersus RN42 TaxID=1160509 RepID=A0A3N4HH79_ASCIM|nr:hypothetical protein BJ508DRAFT_313873 [Ascobolus immersus RN42]